MVDRMEVTAVGEVIFICVETVIIGRCSICVMNGMSLPDMEVMAVKTEVQVAMEMTGTLMYLAVQWYIMPKPVRTSVM